MKISKRIRYWAADIATASILLLIGLVVGFSAGQEPKPGSAYYLEPYDHKVELRKLYYQIDPQKYNKICQEICHK